MRPAACGVWDVAPHQMTLACHSVTATATARATLHQAPRRHAAWRARPACVPRFTSLHHTPLRACVCRPLGRWHRIRLHTRRPGAACHGTACWHACMHVYRLGMTMGGCEVADKLAPCLRAWVLQKYRDGGIGVLRPAALQLGGGPVPGICEGLAQASTPGGPAALACPLHAPCMPLTCPLHALCSTHTGHLPHPWCMACA